ncbi:sugar phosphate nucleotidyltransferase [Lentilitoribacter sp. Alg239-R112]|uniref:sugar phosphate nucleotidyltransferase n=1 Tax=Lentilitoribacter sp. Alg239-R112 TaxID=2305987 RepID=UPI0013A6CBA5|nr:sugar phosphate nucleotidyltransferase [Lentilitoribacter sp. Alg239-R112]
MTTLFILAGGFGTRLRSVVTDAPKALAPIGSHPFLRLQLEGWIGHGLRSFVFLLHHRADLIIDYLQKEKKLLRDCEVRWVIEPNPMGTGGAVSYAISELNFEGEFLLTNADTWLSEGVANMLTKDTPTIGVVKLENTSRYGQIKFNKEFFVEAFVEKGLSQSAGSVNAGLYKLHSALFDKYKGQPFSLETELLPELVQNKSLRAVPLNTNFIDIGIPADYARFCDWVKQGGKGSLCN